MPISRTGILSLPSRWTVAGLRLFFVLGSLAIVMLALFSQKPTESAFAGIEDMQRYSESASNLDALQVALVDAEAGMRGYLLTGLPSYLKPYEMALGSVDKAMDQLVHESVLRTLEPQKLALLQEQVRGLRTHLHALLATHWPQSGELDRRALDDSKQSMDTVRSLIVDLRSRIAQANADARVQFAQQLRLSSSVLLGMSAVVAGLIVWMFLTADGQIALRNRLATVLGEQTRELERVVRVRTQELAQVSRLLNDAEENERQRLARELHDELGSILTAARIEAAALREEVSKHPACAAQMPRFERLIQWLGQGIAIKRRVIDDLRPPLLESLGLVESLHELAEDFTRRTATRVKLSLPDRDPELSSTQTLALFRITQEALTNIQKHAEATQVSIEMEEDIETDPRDADKETRYISLNISDDGRGFDSHPRGAGKTHGLLGIRHRLSMFDGTLEIRSSPGQGTRLIARMPCEAIAHA